MPGVMARVDLPSWMGGGTMRIGGVSDSITLAARYEMLLDELAKALRAGDLDEISHAAGRRSEFIHHEEYRKNHVAILKEVEKAGWTRDKRHHLESDLFVWLYNLMQRVAEPILDMIGPLEDIDVPKYKKGKCWTQVEALLEQWDDIGERSFAGREHWEQVRHTSKQYFDHGHDADLEMANRDIMTIIARVEEVRGPWQHQWDHISDGFLLKDDEDDFDDGPFASQSSLHNSSHSRKQQRRGTVEVGLPQSEQYHVVSEFNHLLDQLHLAVYDSGLGEDMHAPQYSHHGHGGHHSQHSMRLVDATQETMEELKHHSGTELDHILRKIHEQHKHLADWVKRNQGEALKVAGHQDSVCPDIGVWSYHRRKKLRDDMFRVMQVLGEAEETGDMAALGKFKRHAITFVDSLCGPYFPQATYYVEEMPIWLILVVPVLLLIILIVVIVKKGILGIFEALIGGGIVFLVVLGFIMAVKMHHHTGEDQYGYYSGDSRDRDRYNQLASNSRPGHGSPTNSRQQQFMSRAMYASSSDQLGIQDGRHDYGVSDRAYASHAGNYNAGGYGAGPGASGGGYANHNAGGYGAGPGASGGGYSNYNAGGYGAGPGASGGGYADYDRPGSHGGGYGSPPSPRSPGQGYSQIKQAIYHMP